MPIHDLGYQRWEGRLTPESTRWRVITQTGVRLAWRSRWLRRLMLGAWLPAFYLGAAFFFYEQVMANASPGMQRVSTGFLMQFLESPGQEIQDNRHNMWALLLMIFFRQPQAVYLVLIVGLIAPSLIARDVGSRAFLLYFSRPMTRVEYIFGKLAVLWAYVLMSSAVPALALYLLGVLLSPPELDVILSTWDLLPRILLASAVLIVPTTTMALAFSSLTTETRYASFGWFAVWTVGWITHGILLSSSGGKLENRWTLVSLYHTLGTVQQWVFGLGGSFEDVLPAVILLVSITIVSLVVLFRRVSAPMRM